jgi:hypothetical protein
VIHTALSDGHRLLYHWQPFNEERLKRTLLQNQIYCSRPNDFNDPWDCKPHFNTEILDDQAENERHANWAVEVWSQHYPGIPEVVKQQKRALLLADRIQAAKYLTKISEGMVEAINARYRVYCLGPDVQNLLMWAHYADNHRGVCLEFDLRNEVFSGALRCDYSTAYPLMKAYDNSDDAALLALLAKGDAWQYEEEYRLVAQERKCAIEGADTLLTDEGQLQLPKGALISVIVGCQAKHEEIQRLVEHSAPHVHVRRARRVPNRYALQVED